MPKFLIHAEVKKARGRQTYRIEAADADEARALFDCADGEFVEEEIEVIELGALEIEEEPPDAGSVASDGEPDPG